MQGGVRKMVGPTVVLRLPPLDRHGRRYDAPHVSPFYSATILMHDKD